MQVVELHEEMEGGGKEVKEVKDLINFDQLVRIQVDTDVDTHFIVSLSRTSTVAELRELVKATHRHCYPDSGDVDIGKLAVPGRDYGYHLADFLLIGQVYERFKGKVFAEVKNHDPASISSQGLSRMQALSLKTSSTQKKVPLLAPQSFENVAAQISTNTSGYVPLLDPRGAIVEPRALLPVELNSCEPQIVELLVPKLQKEEIDEDGNCYLLSQEPLNGFPSKVRGLAVGSFERIVEEEDEKVVERLSIAVNDDGGVDVSGADLVPKVDHLDPDMDLADLHMKTSKTSAGAVDALSSDIQGVSRKRVASESNERPSKLRRLAEQTPSGNTSKAPLENGRYESGNGEIELSKDESPNLDGVNDVVKDVNTSASLSHMNRAGDLDPNYLSGSKRKKKEALQSCDLTIGENQSEAENDAMVGVEDKEEMHSGEVGRKERPGGTHLVTGSGLEGSGNNCLEVGREENSSLPENVGVLVSFGQKGKKKQKLKKEKVPEQEKTQKRKKKGRIQKPVKETEQEESEREEEPEQEKGKKQKKGKSKQEKELKQEKEKREREKQEIELEREKQEQEKQEREKQEREKQEKEKQEKEKQEREKQEKEKQEREKQEREKQEKEKQEEEKQERELKHEREKQKIELERKKQEKERKKQERELKKEKEKQERELKQEQEKQKKEKEEKKKQEREQQEKEKQEKEKQERELKLEQEKVKQEKEKQEREKQERELKHEREKLEIEQERKKQERERKKQEKREKKEKMEKRDKEKTEEKKEKKRKQTIDEDSGRLSASDIVKDEISESGTPQGEAQMSRDTSGEDMIQDGAVAMESENIDVEEASPQVGSVESKETPSPSKPLSYTRAGRGAPSQTRSIASFRDATKSKQIGGTDETNESQSSQFLEKATQQSEGINLGSEVTGAWLRRSRLESEGGGVDQSPIPKSGEVAHSRSSTGESSAESGPRFADQTEVRSYQDVSRKEDEILEALHTNHGFRTVKRSEKHANTSAKRTDGDVNLKNDSLEFFSQDQSFHVAPTQVEKALSDSSEDNSDESETDSYEDTDKLKKQTSGNLNITQRGPGESKESSDESGDLARPGSVGLTTRTPVPSVSRMIGNVSSQSFKRRSSGVSAEIEAKFAQFIESQGGLDEIMGITLGQQKCSLPLESSTQVGLGARSTGSMATPFGSPLDLALNTQESVKYSPIVLDIAQASQNSAEKFKTPQFKVPKPVPVGTMSGFQGVFNSAATTVALADRKGSTPKELRLRRNESTPPVDNEKEAGSLLVKHNNDIALPELQSSKETFLGDKDAEKWKPKSVGNSSPSLRPETLKVTFLDALNTVGKSSEKTKRSEEENQDSQFMIVNNTDHILEDDRRVKKLGSKGETKGSSGLEDGSLVSPKSGKDSKERKVKKEFVETDVFGSPDMVVPDTSGRKRRKEPVKEGLRKKRMKFPPEELVGKEVTILPENSVERSARETEELYVKLEKANRDLWLKSNSVSSFKKGDKKIGNRNYPAADLDDTEGAEGEDVAQSRLVGRETEIDDVGNHNSKVVDDAAVDEVDPADRDPSPELCAGTAEASDREDSAFESQDVKAETSQQDVFDFVSGDELPTKVLSKSNEKKNSKRMEELSGKAVQRVLEDEMLHVVDTVDIPFRKARKSPSPVNWTVKMRLSPTPLAPSLLGGTVPSNAAEVLSSPNIMRGAVIGEGEARVKPPRKSKAAELGPFICPVGCGREYVKKTSSYYEHKRTCSGAPKTPKTREL